MLYSFQQQQRSDVAHQLLLPSPMELITVEEMKAQAYITACPDENGNPETDPETDALLTMYITAAREYLEGLKNRAFVAQTWQQLTTFGPTDDAIQVWPCPVQQILSMSAIDSTGAETVLSLSDYGADLRSWPAVIRPKYDTGWWSNACWPYQNQIRLEYIAGDLMPVTADATTDQLTALPERTYTANERIVLSNRGGALPAPLVATQRYYVVNPSGSTL